MPKHESCGICQKYYTDYRAHIKSDEHRKLTSGQTTYHDEIDSLIAEMNSELSDRKKAVQHIQFSKRRFQTIYEDADSTAFKLMQPSILDFSIQQTATRTQK